MPSSHCLFLLTTRVRYSGVIFLIAAGLRVAASLVPLLDPWGDEVESYNTARTLFTSFGVGLSLYSATTATGMFLTLSRISRRFGVLVLAIQKMVEEIKMYTSRHLPPSPATSRHLLPSPTISHTCPYPPPSLPRDPPLSPTSLAAPCHHVPPPLTHLARRPLTGTSSSLSSSHS